ncbi:MAG: M23 family metallopeptidase [Saprospiraceae bacterium]|nr:M23 family metallopeptidase [Saprospiraceae bacterium]MCB9356433.1 M23 family metallopeptidase [Lewinellaceae bacterium]
MRKYWFQALLLGAFLVPILSFENADPDDPGHGADYPKDYFQPPVADNAIRLNGTFGELRSNHFHTGIDIDSKTGGVGQPVFSAADGFVDRVKVQAGGYGNVVYIKHPNGYTTVYAHLLRFSPEIERYVKEIQYKRERFEVDLRPPDGVYKVKKGEEIGKLGNSGGSTGPHLHFEIRKSSTGNALNPLLFGLPITDKVAPDIRDMKVYFLNEKREVLMSKAFPLQQRSDGSIGVFGDTVSLGAWRVGFGVKAYDRQSGHRNDNGIFAIRMFADGQLAYQWQVDEIDFDESRYLNAHVDYSARQRYGAWFHRCFVLPGDRMSNYSRTETLGAISLSKEKPVKIDMQITDAAGNRKNVTFWVKRDEPMESYVSTPYQYELPYDAESHIDLEDFTMTMPKGALYETLLFQFKTTPDDSESAYSSTYHLHDSRTPVHRYFEIGIKPRNLPAELRNKAIIAKCQGKRPDNCGGSWRGDFLVTKVRELGDYCVMIDNTPPTITPVVFSADMRKKNTMSFRIRDNLDVNGSADGLSYRGTVDGKWVLFEYDRKRDRITHTFDGRIGRGQHQLRLVVKDDRGNEAIFERSFTR